MDAFGRALLDQFNNNAADVLWLHNSYGEAEEMPVDIFFRTEAEMPEMELYALEYCKGKVLDIGAGVGSHTLVLQNSGMDVTALEISPSACSIMKQRNIRNVINADFFRHQGSYDTLLMLMNGIGIAGTLKNLPALLAHCRSMLNKNGQIIFDSSDISYLYDDIPHPENRYFGEVSYQYEYKGFKGSWFDWLYVDQKRLETVAQQEGFKTKILLEDENDQYLAVLSII